MSQDSLFVLTSRQIKGIKSIQWKARKGSDCRLLVRCHAILMRHRGLQSGTVASIVGVHPNSVRGWVRRVEEHGIYGLLDKEYPGAAPKLDAEQKDRLRAIVEGGPESFGWDTGVWTGPLVREVILREFGVRYHVSQVRRILDRLGFSVQYPRIRLSKADTEKQEEWLKVTMPEIKKKSKRSKES